MTRRVRLIISGRVQGVFFRASTQKIAEKSDIYGTVRNLPDGRVEVIAEGENEAMEKFIAWCHRGPKGASVNEVIISDIHKKEVFHNFSIS